MTRYAFLDKNIKARNIADFVQRHDWVPLQLTEDTIVPTDATAVAVHGVLRGNAKVIQWCESAQIPWVYMDNAGTYFPQVDMYKRITISATAPQFLRDGKRFDHGVTLKKWRGGSGEKILLLPPSPPYMDAFGLRDFLNEMAHSINVYTGRDIILRAKPAKGRFARPLQEQLDEAYCVITWGSAIAFDAMIQGIPTISLGWCPAKFASKKLEDLETDKMKEEPDRMRIVDSLTWSCFAKNEMDSAYNIVMENYQCNL